MTERSGKEAGGLKGLLKRLEGGKFAPLVQFVKFGLVGVSNTAISYGIEMLCYYVLFRNVAWDEKVKIAVISALAFIVSVTNSYYWNNRFVFAQGKKSAPEHLKTYLKTMACYALTGLVLAPALKIWLNGLGWPYWLASLASLAVTIPLNFVLNKFWAFGKKKETEEAET